MSTPAQMAMTVSAHMCPETTIRARVHAEENYVVLRLEGSGQGWTELMVFADRAELARLVGAATATLAELDEKRAVLEQGRGIGGVAGFHRHRESAGTISPH